jgi:hypothetical protein
MYEPAVSIVEHKVCESSICLKENICFEDSVERSREDLLEYFIKFWCVSTINFAS